MQSAGEKATGRREKCLRGAAIEGGITKQTVMELLQLLLINIYIRLPVRFFTTRGIEAHIDIPLNNKYKNLFAKKKKSSFMVFVMNLGSVL